MTLSARERAEQIRRWQKQHEPNYEEFERYLAAQIEEAEREAVKNNWSNTPGTGLYNKFVMKKFLEGFATAKAKANGIAIEEHEKMGGHQCQGLDECPIADRIEAIEPDK